MKIAMIVMVEMMMMEWVVMKVMTWGGGRAGTHIYW